MGRKAHLYPRWWTRPWDKLQELSWLPSWFSLTVSVEKEQGSSSRLWLVLNCRTLLLEPGRKKQVELAPGREHQHYLNLMVASGLYALACVLFFVVWKADSEWVCVYSCIFVQLPMSSLVWLPPFCTICFRCCGNLSVCFGLCHSSSLSAGAVVSPSLNITLYGRDKRCYRALPSLFD